MDLLNIPSMELLQRSHKEWVEETLRIGRSTRDGKWSESIAVGSKGLTAMVKKQRGIRAKGWMIAEVACEYQLRETQSPYSTNFGVQNGLLSSNSLHSWKPYPLEPDTSVRGRLYRLMPDSSLRRADNNGLIGSGESQS